SKFTDATGNNLQRR
ncbi:hypothetical protein, partial [Candidatus Pseudothioglobus singularis]